MSAVSIPSASALRNISMYWLAFCWSGFSARSRWKMAGCGALTMTSRSSRSGFMSAKAQATAPPQSWATNVNFFDPR